MACTPSSSAAATSAPEASSKRRQPEAPTPNHVFLVRFVVCFAVPLHEATKEKEHLCHLTQSNEKKNVDFPSQ